MNRSAPLSADARRLLELGSHVDPPTAEQNERMDRALAVLFRAGRGGPTSSAASPSRGEPMSATPEHRPGSAPVPVPRRWLEPLQGGLSGGKLWLSIGALAATAGASFWLGRLSMPAAERHELDAIVAPTSAPAAAQGALPLGDRQAPANLPSTDGVEASLAAGGLPGANAAEPGPKNPAARKPLAAGPKAPRARDSLGAGLAADIEQLAQAEAALRQGRAANALSVLDQRRVLQLLEQAAALRAIAECELGSEAAARRARGVLERWPGSAFQARIGNACRL